MPNAATIGSKDAPVVTIVTVVRNAVDEIEDTLKSVAALKTPAVEYVVMDGGSTDGTVDLIRKYAGHIDHWVSQPDAGIYDAMNRALPFAHGDYVLNMNAGDRLLALPVDVLASQPDSVAAVCGEVETEDGRVRPRWDRSIRRHNTLPHQGCFYRRTTLLRHPYDLCRRIFADYDLNLSLYAEGCDVRLLPLVVAFHSVRGVSNDSRHARELFDIIRSHCGNRARWQAWLYFKIQGLKSRWQKQGF